jgi:hypothetical protein
MPQTPPPEVDVLPDAPSSQNPIPFAGIMDTFLAALAPFRAGMIALVTNCYNNAVDAYNSAVGAAASLAAVVAASGATEWVSGTTYGYGVVVWSPLDFLSYRRKVAGAGTTDPSLDATNWASLNVLMDTSLTSNSIDIGPKSFTVSTGKGWRGGMYLVIADTAEPSTNSMFAQITSYNSGSGALVVRVITVEGYGTHSDWTISQSSAGGAALTDIYQDNIIINDFSVWQLGDTINSTGSSTVDWCADMWRFSNAGAASAFTASHQTYDSPINAPMADVLRILSNTGATNSLNGLEYVVEYRDIKYLRGKSLTFSFWGRCSSGTYSQSLSAQSGTLTTDVYPAVGASLTGQSSLGSESITYTTSWQLFTLSCTTVPDATGQLRIIPLSGAIPNGVWIELCDPRLTMGSVRSHVRKKTYNEKLRACQWYLPCINVGIGGAYSIVGNGQWISDNNASVDIRFPVECRIPPNSMAYSSAPTHILNASGTSVAISSILLGSSSKQMATLSVSTAGGAGVAGHAAEILYTTTAGQIIYFKGARL